MPNISTLTPIKQLLKPEEVSHLRSPRDSATAYNAWKREKEIVSSHNQLIQLVNQLCREMKRLGERHTFDLQLFPFKIYNIEDNLQNNPFDSNNWLNYNIRGGYVFTEKIDTGSCWVNGTDRMEKYSYQSTLNQPTTIGQYIIPANTPKYWFWVETSSSYSGSEYFIRASATPETPDVSSTGSNPNGWENWPSVVSSSNGSGSNYIIGYVDTATSAAYNVALVRQIQVGDILSSAALPEKHLFVICEDGAAQYWYLYGYPASGSTMGST
jgi:hypothetical protein